MQTETMDTADLWERFHRELFLFVRGRVDSDATAEDVLQHAFLRAHTYLLGRPTPEHPRAWLYQIVRNLIVDTHRRNGRQHALAEAVSLDPTIDANRHSAHALSGSSGSSGSTSSTSSTGSTESTEARSDADAFALVARALPMFVDSLEQPYRDALRMTELEGLSQAEAAQRAGVGLSGMKSRVQRGRKHVFDKLQRCCEFELDGRGRMMACAPISPDKHGEPSSCC